MKRNVDLTSNRMFSSRNTRQIGSGLPFLKLDTLLPGKDLGTLFPWSVERFKVVRSDDELSSGANHEIIITGDASTREHKRFWRAADAGDMCDCCGTDLNRKPWDRHYCLCSKCMSGLDITVEKLWKYRDDLIDNSTDRIVLEMNFRPR